VVGHKIKRIVHPDKTGNQNAQKAQVGVTGNYDKAKRLAKQNVSSN